MRLTLLYMKKMAMNEMVSLISADNDRMSNRYNAMLEYNASTILDTFSKEAESILSSNRDKIDILAKELIKKETLDLKQIRDILGMQ